MTKVGEYKVGAKAYAKDYRAKREDEYYEFMAKQKAEKGGCVDCGTMHNLCFVRKDGKPKKYQSILGFAELKKNPDDYFFRCHECNLKAHHARKGWVQHPRRVRHPKEKGLKKVIAETYPTCKNCNDPHVTHVFRYDYATIKLSQKELKKAILNNKDTYFGCCDMCNPKYKIAKMHYKLLQR